MKPHSRSLLDAAAARARRSLSARDPVLREAAINRARFDLRAALKPERVAPVSPPSEDLMTTVTRHYVIRKQGSTDITAIIRAATPAGALRHHCRDLFTVGVASVDDVLAAQAAGVAPVTAAADDDAQGAG